MKDYIGYCLKSTQYVKALKVSWNTKINCIIPIKINASPISTYPLSAKVYTCNTNAQKLERENACNQWMKKRQISRKIRIGKGGQIGRLQKIEDAKIGGVKFTGAWLLMGIR